jgi:hypothetical protein
MDNTARSLDNSYGVSDNEISLTVGDTTDSLSRLRGESAAVSPADLGLRMSTGESTVKQGQRRGSSSPSSSQNSQCQHDSDASASLTLSSKEPGGDSSKDKGATGDGGEMKDKNDVDVSTEQSPRVDDDGMGSQLMSDSKASDSVFQQGATGQSCSQSTAGDQLAESHSPQHSSSAEGAEGGATGGGVETNKPDYTQSVPVESDGEVWQRRSASEECKKQEAAAHNVEKVTSMDGGGSRPGSAHHHSRSRTPSGSSVISVSRSKSFIDEQQARQYLAKQFEEDEEGGHKPEVGVCCFCLCLSFFFLPLFLSLPNSVYFGVSICFIKIC